MPQASYPGKSLKMPCAISSCDCYIILFLGGEQVEMGGIVDPERGALIYRKTTQFETVEPDKDSEFTMKKIKKVTSESTWLGQGKEPEPQAKEPLSPQDQEAQPWHDEEVVDHLEEIQEVREGDG